MVYHLVFIILADKMKESMKGRIWIAIIIAGIGMVACGNAAVKKQEVNEQVVQQEQKKRGFQLPEVPVMLNTPELRLSYVVQHYWDHFDFRDTVYIHLPDITEQATVDFMDLLQRVPQDEALSALVNLAGKATVEPKMMSYFWDTLSKYWHDPNSPMKNEDMFILLCKGMEQTPQVQGYLKEKVAYLRELAEKNRVGMKAADFTYTLASGKQGRLSGLKSPYTLVFFYNPDCHTCADIKQAMHRSIRLKDLVASGQMKVLTIYPDEDVALWRNHLGEMSDEWINGYDKGQVLTVEKRYDLSSIPSFYLLDKDKKVLLKDADWREVMQFLEK